MSGRPQRNRKPVTFDFGDESGSDDGGSDFNEPAPKRAKQQVTAQMGVKVIVIVP